MQLAPGARGRALLLAGLALPLGLLAPPVGVVLLAAALGVRWFFRDPERTPPPDGGAVSPADGEVTVVRTETVDGVERLRVGVFMSPTDVHVNRAPLAGSVADVAHEPGGHWPAFSKAAERNERLHVESAAGWRVTLIAGTMARRITPYVAAGDRLERGERIGHIAFGSRADVLFPPGVTEADLSVAVGDTVTAGETVLLPSAAAGTGGPAGQR